MSGMEAADHNSSDWLADDESLPLRPAQARAGRRIFRVGWVDSLPQ